MIDQWFPSSKKCCKCGQKKEDLKLSHRIYECDNCGLKIDRDLNASINLANANDDVIVESIGWAKATNKLKRNNTEKYFAHQKRYKLRSDFLANP